MRRTIFAILAVVGLLLPPSIGYVLIRWRVPALSSIATVQKHGLKISITSLRRVDEQLEVSYQLEWVRLRKGENYLCYMHPCSFMEVTFWDANDIPIAESRAIEELLGPDFTLGDTKLRTNRGTFSLPKGAKKISIGYPGPGMMTRPVEVPD
jgi:hypothetical protein